MLKFNSTLIPKSEMVLNKYIMFFCEEITKRIEEGAPVDNIYLDFQKAFDKVPYQRVLLKLKAQGNGDGIFDWTEQWLTDSKQGVGVYGVVSNWKSVFIRVLQVSMLGLYCSQNTSYVIKMLGNVNAYMQDTGTWM